MSQFVSAKDPDETRTLTISFAAAGRLNPSETIVSAEWLVELEDGTPVDSATLLEGSPDCSTSPLVKQAVKGGLNGKAYLHRAKALTSTGRTICGGGILWIRKGA